jgi:hypothetical protein
MIRSTPIERRWVTDAAINSTSSLTPSRGNDLHEVTGRPGAVARSPTGLETGSILAIVSPCSTTNRIIWHRVEISSRRMPEPFGRSRTRFCESLRVREPRHRVWEKRPVRFLTVATGVKIPADEGVSPHRIVNNWSRVTRASPASISRTMY